MGKIMINGEQYPSYVTTLGIDDTQIGDKAWSSKQIEKRINENVIPSGATPCNTIIKNPSGSNATILIGFNVNGITASTTSGTFKYVFTVDGKVYGTSTFVINGSNSGTWTHEHEGNFITDNFTFQTAPLALSTTPFVFCKKTGTLGEATNDIILATAFMGRIGMWKIA